MRSGWTIGDVPERLSWFSVLQFYRYSGPHSAVVRYEQPDAYGWDIGAQVTAAGLGVKAGPQHRQAAAVSSGPVRTRHLGTPINRADIPDFWL